MSRDYREVERRNEQQRSIHRSASGSSVQKPNRKGLLGLYNLGNTCFMNAALQCLAHTHGLQKYFRHCQYQFSSRSPSQRQKLILAFAHWFERDWGKNISAQYHSPEDILSTVQRLNPMFQGYSQQDSQEFLRCVLDNIHEELRKEVPDDLAKHLLKKYGPEAVGEAMQEQRSASGSAQADGESSATSSSSRVRLNTSNSGSRPLLHLCQGNEVGTDAGELRMPSKNSSVPGFEPGSPREGKGTAPEDTDGKEGKEEPAEPMHFTSIVSELFQGKVVSVVRCVICNKTSRTTEVMYDVSVPIPTQNELNGSALVEQKSWLSSLTGKVKSMVYDKGVEIQDCLRKYCAPEQLSGRDQYFCESCKRKNDCEKRIRFKELPEVLCIHIKRFRYDSSWFTGTKNSRVVSFPVRQALDMKEFLDEPASHTATEYRLTGLIQHIGSMGGGHYIAYCRHKRQPQDWFEFDDMQVTLVQPELVEKAEGYVLFYQRTPSKGSRLDRKTFKEDQRSMQDKIATHLKRSEVEASAASSQTETDRASEPPSSAEGPASMLAGPPTPATSSSATVASEGAGWRNVFHSPPAELDLVFVTKHWYVKLTTMSNPGPVDNHLYLCPHQLLGSSSPETAVEPFVPISRSLFQSLVKKYGGGPLIGTLETCPKCMAHLRAYNDRRQAELDLVTKYDTKDTGEGKHWYLVDAVWVNDWKRYVRAEPVSDIRDMCAPGPVTNQRLLDKEHKTLPRPNLRLRVDYIGVNAKVWWLFMHVHGGGPPIIREELDMYSASAQAETELVPEELQGGSSGSHDPSSCRRVSWQFVDECKGDLELYEKSYPSQLARESQEQGEGPKEPEADRAEPAEAHVPEGSERGQEPESQPPAQETGQDQLSGPSDQTQEDPSASHEPRTETL